MRIISNFKDYYDAFAGIQTADELPIFIRERAERPFELHLPGGAGLTDTAKHLLPAIQLLNSAPSVSALSTAFNHISMEVTIVSGVMYPSYFDRPRLSWITEHPIRWNTVPEIIEAAELGTVGFNTERNRSDLTALRKSISHAKDEKCDKTRLFHSQSKNTPPTRLGFYPFSLYGWQEFVRDFSDGFSGKDSIPPETHRFFRSPVLHVFKLPSTVHYTCVVNPCLKDLSFSSVRHPHLLAQDIDQYLGNQMARQVDPIPVRTQELIRDAHGFDDKSFKHGTPDRRTRKQHKP